MPVLRDENEYFSSITRCEECQKRVPDNSANSEREQEFSHWVLHGTGAKQEWKHGHRCGSKAGIAKRQKTPELFNWLALISIQAEGRQRAEASELMSRHNSPRLDISGEVRQTSES